MNTSVVEQYEKDCMADRRVWPWLSAVLMNWILLIGVMVISLHYALSSLPLFLRTGVFVIGMWSVGVFIYRLSILGHDAGHRTISNNPKLNDALANCLIFYPCVFSLTGYRMFHNEGHHPKAHNGTLRDPECVMKRIERHWALPISRAQIIRRFVLNLCGSSAQGILAFMLFMATPRMYARFVQFLTLALHKRDQVDADILPLRMKDIVNTPRAIIRDVLSAFALMLFKLCVLVLVVMGIAGLFGFAQWPLILLMWFGGFATSFWALFNLRMLCEHVGTNTMQLREPSLLWKFFVFPHGVWAHKLHHNLPGMPFHRLKDVLRARQAHGVAVSDVIALVATSQPVGSGEVPAADDARDLLNRAAKQGLLGPVV